MYPNKICFARAGENDSHRNESIWNQYLDKLHTIDGETHHIFTLRKYDQINITKI